MGSIAWDDRDADERTPTFGSAENDRVVMLMRIEHQGGEWRYRDEVAAINRREALREPWYDLSGKEQTASWWRETVRVSARQRSIQSKHSLVLATYPYSVAQIDVAPFKRGSQKGASDRPDVAEFRFANEADFQRWIESHGWDYWEKGKYLVAGVIRPTPMQDARTRQRRPRQSDPFHTIFGLCETNFDALAWELLQGSRGAALERSVDQDRLKFWFRSATPRMERIPRLSTEIKEDATLLLHLAIRLALAGPVKDSQQWFGRPVMDLAELIFQDFLNNHNRSARTARRREQRLDSPNEIPDRSSDES